jgi:formylglycine-generating enzyme required for sulfatase activity
MFSWYAAASFCNWLSEQEGLPKDQWCYLPAANGYFGSGMTIPADVLRRKGYRLPTEAEWEYACRSGTMTSRYYGLSADLLEGYARYLPHSKEHAWACGSLRPNELGLFDMLGNMFEWVQDGNRAYNKGEHQAVIDSISVIAHIDDSPRLVRGGSFANDPAIVRSARRIRNTPSYSIANYGFRLSRTYP